MKNLILIITGLLFSVSLSAQTSRRVIKLSGTISDKYPISMTLSVVGNDVYGYYYYEKYKTKISLRGHLKENKLKLYEAYNGLSINSDESFRMGFVGELNGSSYSGVWSDLNKEKTLNFNLAVANDAQRTLTNEVVNVEGLYESPSGSAQLTNIDQNFFCFIVKVSSESGSTGEIIGILELKDLKQGTFSMEDCEKLEFQLSDKVLTVEEYNCSAYHGMNCWFSDEYKKVKTLTKDVFVVNSADEFVDAIGSDRTIQLKGNAIYLSTVSSEKKGINYYFDSNFDGYELVINGVENLNIIGLGDDPVDVITKPRYGNVIIFEGCDGITIENVNAGHGPEKGSCTGGVLKFNNCKNININRSVLYGCGIEGITADVVSNLRCVNTKIRSCSYSIMSLKGCSNFEFVNCDFDENKEFDMVNLQNCSNIMYNSCIFRNNTDEDSDLGYNLFHLDSSKEILLENCQVKSNMLDYFGNTSDGIKVTNTRFENNTFRKGLYKE